MWGEVCWGGMVTIPVRFRNFRSPTLRVLESLKAGKRQSEARFVTLKIAAKGQQSVYNMFKKP